MNKTSNAQEEEEKQQLRIAAMLQQQCRSAHASHQVCMDRIAHRYVYTMLIERQKWNKHNIIR